MRLSTPDLGLGTVHLGALTRHLAERYGDRRAIEDDAPTPGLHAGGWRTHLELEKHVARLAAAHADLGTVAGNRVLIMVANRLDVVLHALALARLDAVAVPVNPHLKDAELAAIAEAASAVRVVADADSAARLGAVDDETLAALDVVPTGDEDPATGIAGWLAEHPRATRTAPEDQDVDATTILLATSGTTGLPKAAALTSRGLTSTLGRLAVAPVGRQRGPRAGRDLILAALPLTHVMGLAAVLGAMATGVPLLHRSRFDAAEALDVFESRRPNTFVGVPTMYADLEAAGADERDLSSVQLFISGADVMPPDRARRFQRRGAIGRVAGRGLGTAAFIDGYGMVELSGAAALRLYPPSPTGKIDVPSFAVALPGNKVRAVDEDGRPVGRGEVGELQFAGPGVTKGYEGRPDSGADAEGWFSTGDYGRVWAGGVFAFAGRSRDRLKVGGFSVFPAEVEELLRDHPAVRDVAVVGLPDDRLGERPVALVVAAADFDREGFLAWAAEHVAGYRRPRAVAVVDDLPRGNHGKLDRRTATERAGTLLG